MKAIIVRKGGPGSGNFGHSGLPGVWGGSRPRSGGKVRARGKIQENVALTTSDALTSSRAVTIGDEPEDVDSLHAQIIKSGGFTYEPLTNSSPTTGFVVSAHKDREAVFDAATFTRKDIIRYINKNSKLLAGETTHLGAWFNSEDGKIYLDVSEIFNSRNEALNQAKNLDEIAIWDLGAMEEIRVKMKKMLASYFKVTEDNKDEVADAIMAMVKSKSRKKQIFKFTRKKGGPGSGFRGHSGLPGVWGGSRPRGGGGKVTGKGKIQEDVDWPLLDEVLARRQQEAASLLDEDEWRLPAAERQQLAAERVAARRVAGMAAAEEELQRDGRPPDFLSRSMNEEAINARRHIRSALLDEGLTLEEIDRLQATGTFDQHPLSAIATAYDPSEEIEAREVLSAWVERYRGGAVQDIAKPTTDFQTDRAAKIAELKEKVAPRIERIKNKPFVDTEDTNRFYESVGALPALVSERKLEAQLAWENVRPEGSDVELEDFVATAYEFTDEETGISSQVTRVYVAGSNISVKGVFFKGGNRVGSFIRDLKPGGGVEHDYMRIDIQGVGFGRKFYQNSEDTYVAAGMKRITLSANINVGGYAWARMGFDWNEAADSSNRQSIKNSFKIALQYSGAVQGNTELSKQILDNFETLKPWDIAAMQYGNERFGKETLMGTYWQAIKMLNEDDEGFLVGQSYYQEHEKE